MRPFEQKIRVFISQFILALLVFTVLRIAFYLYNSQLFPEATMGEFTSGIRFDFAALFWIHLPFIVLSLVGLLFSLNRFIEYLREFLFQIGMVFSITFSVIDMEYFKFTLRRSTYDLIRWTDSGGDLAELAPKFLVEFWPLVLFFGFLVGFSVWAYRKIQKHEFKVTPQSRTWYQKGLVVILLAGFFFIGGRGGFALVPINIVDAGLYTSGQNTSLVLSTPFTIIRTWGKKGVPNFNFYDPKELDQKFSPIIELKSDSAFTGKNVVIIILESFSYEYTCNSEKAQRLTPFLQQLKSKSTYFPNCFANGKQSIEALPAILSGVPSLMHDPYVSSNYGSNKLGSIATYLKPLRYNSSFYHGGKNGTMSFDSFTSTIGFDAYYGKDEYPNQDDYDGTWGISDEPYLQYFANSLNQTQQPFVSSIFTLSSHHPYKVPADYQDKFNAQDEPIEAVIQYTDFALKKFFEAAEKMPWYNNTLFVLTADHTPWSENAEMNDAYWRFRIPLIFYDPENKVGNTNESICQQTDILPSILHKLNYNGKVLSYGRNAFGSEEGFAVQYINHNYQLMRGGMIFQMNERGPVVCYNRKIDNNLVNTVVPYANCQELEIDLKALIQSYSQRINNNSLYLK